MAPYTEFLSYNSPIFQIYGLDWRKGMGKTKQKVTLPWKCSTITMLTLVCGSMRKSTYSNLSALLDGKLVWFVRIFIHNSQWKVNMYIKCHVLRLNLALLPRGQPYSIHYDEKRKRKTGTTMHWKALKGYTVSQHSYSHFWSVCNFGDKQILCLLTESLC